MIHPNESRTLRSLCTLIVASLLLLGETVSAQAPSGNGAARSINSGGGRGGGGGRNGRGRGRVATDIPTARTKLLETDPPVEEDFTDLVNAATEESRTRKLPSFAEDPETTYGPEQTAFRKEVYGPLLELPKTRDFLRSLASRTPKGAFDTAAVTAALILADAPDAEDLKALVAGYAATPAESRSSIARQVGRALANTRAAEPRPAGWDAALAQLRADALEGKASQRGAAIEGLFRAGEMDDALEVMRGILTADVPPLETISVLQACTRLFQRKSVDPLMKARAIAVAHVAVEELLAGTEELTATESIAGKGRTMRGALTFLQDVGGARELDLLLTCLTDRRAQRLLGMDGLQNLRFALQQRRNKLPPEQGARIDELYLKLLTDAGSRLFALDEEPMTKEEQRSFWEARDLRYNALSYFCDQFMRTPAVKERLGKEGDLPSLLVTFVRAREDVKEESGSEVLFTKVADKLENRAMALQLMALVQREWNRDPGGLDLLEEALAIVAVEVQATLPPLPEVNTFRATRVKGVALEFPTAHVPEDTFVRGAAAQAIADLGYIVSFPEGKMRIEYDAENPWPWPPKGTPTATTGASDQR